MKLAGRMGHFLTGAAAALAIMRTLFGDSPDLFNILTWKWWIAAAAGFFLMAINGAFWIAWEWRWQQWICDHWKFWPFNRWDRRGDEGSIWGGWIGGLVGLGLWWLL